MRRTFIINGLPGCGKTLFGQVVGGILQERSIDFLHTSSILPVKHIMLSKHAWDENIVPKDQWDELYVLRASITTESWDGITKNVFWHRIMSDIKLLVTQHEPDFINAWVMQQVQKRSNNAVVFVDIREPENIESFRQYVGNNYKDVLVKALYIESDVTEDFDNYSDGSVLNYSYDIRVKNPRKIFADELEASKNIHKEALSFIKDYVL